MYATIQKWGNSQGLRIPKALLDAVGLKEHDRVELVQMDDGINIRRASATLDGKEEGLKLLPFHLSRYDRWKGRSFNPSSFPSIISR